MPKHETTNHKYSPLTSLILGKLREYAPMLRWRAAENEDGTTFQAKFEDQAGIFFVPGQQLNEFKKRDEDVTWLDVRKMGQAIQRDLRKAAK